MAHQRDRAIGSTIAHALKQSPCVGLVGMRQTGKSTLLKQFAARYFTFDQAAFSARFEREGAALLEESGYPLALDEIQKYPPAFDALKFSIDHQHRRGRFLISGSVRFSSRRQIRESLTGRIFLLELYPFSLAECHRQTPSEFLSLASSLNDTQLADRLQKRAWATSAQVRHYMEAGGLPGICFLRDPRLREQHFANHLDTLLGRDIQLVRQVKLSVTRLNTLLMELAKNQGLPCRVVDLARKAACSQPTAKAILEALEGLFLIRRFGKTYFLEDAGLSHFLCPLGKNLTRYDVMRCVYYEFRLQLSCGLKHHALLENYTTRGGSDIPFLISYKSGQELALMVEEEALPSDKAVKGLSWYKKKKSRVRALILCDTAKPFHTATGILCLPWRWVF